MHETVHSSAEAECDAGTETIHHYHHKDGATEKEGFEMGDIAGLMALMQGNKGMDLPGLLALCKDKGMDSGFGGQGMFLFVFLILFLFAGGGFGNLGAKNQAAFAEMAGPNCQNITGLYDRIYAAQAESASGFSNLNTHLCTSIAEVVAAVRNQGDRSVAATDAVSRQLSDCCCAMQQKMDAVLCAIRGVDAKVELTAERTNNRIERLEANMNLGFERTQCLITNQAKDQELARLGRENEALRSAALAQASSSAAVSQIEKFMVQHYRPDVCGCNPCGLTTTATTRA